MDVPINAFWGFVEYDRQTKLPIRSQYNFNFQEYNNDFKVINPIDKKIIFRDFWIRNECELTKPSFVKPELIKYFFNITPNIIDYINYNAFAAHYGRWNNPSTAFPELILLEQQFDIIYYLQSERPLVEDFYYENNENLFTKFNFDFDKFSNEFNIWGCKRSVFTQFIIRNRNFNPEYIYIRFGYKILPEFEKYFFKLDKNGINEYLINYSINNYIRNNKKNTQDIDWVDYLNKYPNIINEVPSSILFWIKWVENHPDFGPINTPEELNIVKAEFHWYEFGQLEFREMSFITPILTELDKFKNSICAVYTSSGTCSGFRIFYPDNQFYVLTVYNLLAQNLNNKLFIATFEYVYDNGIKENITAQFRLIGRDAVVNFAIGKFEEDLPFNIQNGLTLEKMNIIQPIIINEEIQVNSNNKIYIYGYFLETLNTAFIPGVVINSIFSGNTLEDNYDYLYYNILSQCTTGKSMIGGPQIIQKDDGKFYCVGMTNFDNIKLENINIGIPGNILSDFIRVSIFAWFQYVLFVGLNYSILDQVTDFAKYRSWLGATGYYNSYLTRKDNKLSNFYYTGGFVLTNIYQGFNYKTKKFVYNTFEINNKNIIQVYSPLNNTTIHKRLIESNAPIVIKNLIYYDAQFENYLDFNIGKYNGQYTLSKFYIGCVPIAYVATNDPSFEFFVRFEYPIIKIIYSYYNGESWVDDFEFVGGNDPSWYVTYENLSGQKSSFHKFTLPSFLLIYLVKSYSKYVDNT